MVGAFCRKIEEEKNSCYYKKNISVLSIEFKGKEFYTVADVIEKFTTKASDSFCDKKINGLRGKETLESFSQYRNFVQKDDLS